jgi:hypothetical protein
MNIRTLVLGAACATLMATGSIHASVPLGVYAVVDKVLFEPDEAQPERVKIWGAFALWEGKSAAGYRAPERGFLYYRCEPKEIDLCRAEWADLKSVAGTTETVGFGSRSLTAGRVRRSDDQGAAADMYPIQYGVVRLGTSRGRIFEQLKAAAQGR